MAGSLTRPLSPITQKIGSRNRPTPDESRPPPSEILLEEPLTPMGIPQNAMARATGVSLLAINEIVLGHRAITPVMLIRFGAFFLQTPEFWHGL